MDNYSAPMMLPGVSAGSPPANIVPGQDLIQSGLSTISKGGMRAAGLIAAMIAEATLRTKMADLAQDYYAQSQNDFNYYTANFLPGIQRTAQEAMSATTNPQVAPDKYASNAAGVGMSAITEKKWFEARRRIPKYNTGQARRLDYDFAVARLQSGSVGWMLGVRYEDTWALAHNKRAWRRKVSVANIGLEIGNTVRHGLANATSSLASGYKEVEGTVASVGNGLAASLGYDAGRETTHKQFGGSNGKS